MSQAQPLSLSPAKRVRVKICGVTTPADARAAAAAGADAIGLVFAKGSPREITGARAADIAAATPPFVARVALFLDNEPRMIERIVEQVPLDLLQFHGRESPALCRGFGRPYAKAVPMGEAGIDPADWAERYHDAVALLLDANRAGQAGGRGETFDWQTTDWQTIIDRVDQPLIVAGGLDPDNVGDAIARFRPYAVDVSSGVERERGVKCREKMAAFIDAVNQAGGA